MQDWMIMTRPVMMEGVVKYKKSDFLNKKWKGIFMVRQKIIIDLEKINGSHSNGCAACNRKFSLGDTAVLAIGSWEGGPRYIHENEAVFDSNTSQYFEKRKYDALRPK